MKQQGRIWRGLLILVFTAQILIGCGGAQTVSPSATIYSFDIPTRWFDLWQDLIKTTPGWTPPVTSRAIGYAGVALYEAVVPGMPGHRSLAGQLNDLEQVPQINPALVYDWQSAANGALASITRNLFRPLDGELASEISAKIGTLERQIASELRLSVAPDVAARSTAHGESVALAIYTWSIGDGAFNGDKANFPSGFELPSGDGVWVATSDKAPIPLQPTWGENRPLMLASGSECAPPAPPTYSTEPGSPFYEEAYEVYVAGRDLTDEQREIAAFWADNMGESSTPPGHILAVTTLVLKNTDSDLGKAAETYAKIGLVVADSFISCWNAKYAYNLMRPVTFIQNYIDASWEPAIPTPPFPEYPSGHSVQSGAAAQVLTDLFGAIAITDDTHSQRGLESRSFANFDLMAEEAAISRLYGGIHYRSAIERGLEQGRCVADNLERINFYQ